VTTLWIVLAGGAGAVARLVLGGVVNAWTGARYPVGTTVINLSGSLLLGLVVGLAGAVLPEPARLVLGTGFLGGYTTFSTAAVETVRLAAEQRRLAAWAHGLGMCGAAVALAALGLWLGLTVAG
jgi:CrcB protein